MVPMLNKRTLTLQIWSVKYIFNFKIPEILISQISVITCDQNRAQLEIWNEEGFQRNVENMKVERCTRTQTREIEPDSAPSDERCNTCNS